MIASSIVIYLELGFPIVGPVYPGLASRATQDTEAGNSLDKDKLYLYYIGWADRDVDFPLTYNEILLYEDWCLSEKKFN